MKHYFITGTSRGIGKALAEQLLKEDGVFVSGIARNKTITHPNYRHFTLNLSDPNNAASFSFPELQDAEEVVLINNAGVISEIKRIGKIHNQSIVNDFSVNIIAPSILMNNFIRTYQNYTNKRSILNVSSGAGRHTIDAWSVYCASKAALDMYSKNIAEEQRFVSEENRIKLYSVAPGVIETAMQEQIRSSSKKDFSEIKKFLYLKENNLLFSPEHAAELLLNILNGNQSEVILDVRKA